MEIDREEFYRLLNEAGEDDEGEEQPADDAEASKADDNAEDDTAAKELADEVDKPFSGLDLRSAYCFGYSKPDSSNWKCIAEQSKDVGWEMVDAKQLEKSLAKDVDKAYSMLAAFKFVDVDDDMAYSLSFDNNKALWQLSISESPKAELDVQQRADFFKAELVKNLAKKTYFRLNDAFEVYNEVVRPHLENGELLLVDAVKLDTVLHFLDTEYVLQNLLNCKYLGY